MKKIITSIVLSLVAVFSFAAETATVVFDGSVLTSSATSADTEFAFGDFTVVMSKGAKMQSASKGKNKFTEQAILIGKQDAYLYNKTPFPGKIVKFEVYANAGASAKVTVGVNFSKTTITAYDPEAANTFAEKLGTLDNVYDLTSYLPEDARYFWYQVTNANNSQVQFRITYELPGDIVKAPEFSVHGGEYYKTQVVGIKGQADADIYYSFDGVLFQKYVSALVISEDATVYAYAQRGNKKSTVSSAKYVIAKKYATFEDLTKVTPANQPVIVSFEKKEIIDLYYTKAGKCNGVYIMSGEKMYEIYCYDVPAEWEVGGFISGTVQGKWQDYNGTWEICPSSWDGVTYTAPVAPEIKPIDVKIRINDHESAEAWASQEACTQISRYLLPSAVEDIEIYAVMPDGTRDESKDGLGPDNGWRDINGSWLTDGAVTAYYSRPVVEFNEEDGIYYFGTELGINPEVITEPVVLRSPFVFVNKNNGREVTLEFSLTKVSAPIYSFVKKSAQVIEVERVRGLGNTVTAATFDGEKVCTALGLPADKLHAAEAFGINSSVAWDVTPVKWIEDAMISYEGWRNSNGDFCRLTASDAAVCVKIDNTKYADNILISTKTANEPRATDPIYNAYWVLAYDGKAVIIITQITFVDENGDGATAITDINKNAVKSADIYDLTGRRVQNITRGQIYIIGGQKVMVK